MDTVDLMIWARKFAREQNFTPDLAMAAHFWEHWDDFHTWLAEVEAILFSTVLCQQPFPPGASEDDRRAAQVAMAALRYLRTPVEEEHIVVRRPAWKGEEAKWIAQVEQEHG